MENNTDLFAPDTHYWLHFEIDTPSLNNSENELVLYIKPQIKDERWWISYHPQITIYVNGNMVQGLDQNHESIKVDENTHLDVYAYCYNTSDAKENPGFKIFIAERDIVPAFCAVALENIHTECNVSVKDNIAENSLYRITLDNSGTLSSIYDKKNSRELLKNNELGNCIRVYEDYPYQYDSWEISNYHELKFTSLSAYSVMPLCDGSRAGFEIKYKYENSEITQKIFLYSILARTDFEAEIDWQEHHRVLKTEFPLDIHTSSAKYEIQYANVDRPTHRNTSWEAAKFEVCGHKWVDLSENGYGVSLLNDCKYGFSAESNTL